MDFIVTDSYPRFGKLLRCATVFIFLTTVFVFYQVSDGFKTPSSPLISNERDDGSFESFSTTKPWSPGSDNQANTGATGQANTGTTGQANTGATGQYNTDERTGVYTDQYSTTGNPDQSNNDGNTGANEQFNTGANGGQYNTGDQSDTGGQYNNGVSPNQFNNGGQHNTGDNGAQINTGANGGQFNTGDQSDTGGQYNNGVSPNQFNTGANGAQINTGANGQYNTGGNPDQNNNGINEQYNNGVSPNQFNNGGQYNTGDNGQQYNTGDNGDQYNSGQQSNGGGSFENQPVEGGLSQPDNTNTPEASPADSMTSSNGQVPDLADQCPAIQMGNIVERLTEFCGGVKRYKNNWYELLTMYDVNPRRLVYDVDRDYVWVTVPKIASSNWKRVILSDKLKDPAKFNESMSKPHIFLQKCCKMTEELALQHSSLQRAFTFAFIRNPWTRLYSAFRDKIAGWKSFKDYEYIRAILTAARGWTAEEIRNKPAVIEASETITFAEFLTMLAFTDTDKYNPHWSPWFILTKACQIKYDYIGYSEDMPNVFNLIKGRVFNDTNIEMPPVYTSHASVEAVKEVYHTVPTAVLDRVYQKFKDDFRIGNYSRNIDCIR